MTSLPVVCLMGPTAIGKTDLAIDLYVELAQQFPIDIISVDSAMVYQGLDIGSGKPSKEMLQSIPHQLIDIRQPHQVYSVADFCQDAKQLINQSVQKKRVPVLVGGTMMYFRALQNGLDDLPGSSPEIRQDLTQKIESIGIAELHRELTKIDPSSAARLQPNDKQRVIRALEVYYLTGQPLSQHHSLGTKKSDITNNTHFVNIVLTTDNRKMLHQRIADRFHGMLNSGFIDECQKLYDNSLITADLPAIKSCGYRQVWYYLSGKMSKQEMTQRAIIATRQLAKRQLTWLRSWPLALNFDIENNDYKEEIIKFLLQTRTFC